GEARVVNVSSAAGEIEPASGWAPAYAVSKAALNALTVKLALAGKPAKVSVNAACPGWVRTAMGGPDAPKAPEQAAEDLAWLALDAPASLSGVFVRDRTVVPW
ncbi:MAG TPA: SDR family NAD(P)-dependent oxidoreductase, partial [Planctomycetota bacterium]|nr:SDR family NAD(P)-dependent oxidoreductase [Planctomycetota bacterium]